MNSFILRLSAQLLLCLLPFTLYAQQRISGRLMADDMPLPYAEVLLQDSLEQLIKGAYTDDAGRFEFEAPNNAAQLKASFLGYVTQVIQLSASIDQDLGDITMEPIGTDLAAITVTAQQQVIEQRADRLIFRVENSVAAAGGTGLAALELTPGIRLQNGALELIGRGNPAVMLDGRLLQLSGEELLNFISSLAADDIASIEVIANPPARYAAAGQGGLLNIVLKNGRSNAWKNNLTVAHTQAFYGNSNLNNTFFYNREKLRFSASGTVARGHQRDIESIGIDFLAGDWKTRMVNKSVRDNLSGRAAIDYQFSKKFSLGGQYHGSAGRPEFAGPATTTITNASGTIDSTLVNAQTSRRPVSSHTANLHGLWTLDTLGRSISFDMDYFDYDNELDQTSTIETILPGGTVAGLNLAQQNLADQRIDNRNAKIDVEHPLKEINLSYGVSLNYTSTFADQRNFNTRSGQAVFDPVLSNEFEYEENVQAAYFNAKSKREGKWDWQVGLRMENTQTESYSQTLDQRTPNDYLKLFPTLFLAYHAGEHNDYAFSYGRRINRPGFRNLNPFRVYVNSNSYSEGNPFLQPSFTDRFEFNHTYRGKLRTNVFFNRTIDGHGTLFAAEDEGNVQATIRRNYYKDYFFGIGESYTLERGSWWTSQNQLYVYAGITDVLPGFATEARNGVIFNLSSNNTFVLSPGTKLQVNAFYTSQRRSNVFTISASYGLTLGLQHKVGKKLQFGLLCNDVFDTASMRSLVSVVDGVRTDYGQNYASRNVRLTASYIFGNDDINVRERGFGNEGVRRRSN